MSEVANRPPIARLSLIYFSRFGVLVDVELMAHGKFFSSYKANSELVRERNSLIVRY